MSDNTESQGVVGIRRERDASHEIHRFWWLYLPIVLYGARYLIYLFSDASSGLESRLRHEFGLVENLTVVFLVLALFSTLAILVRFNGSLHVTVKVFLILYCLGCIYFAGEEASWGQHWFGWETGEFFDANDQHETNFHNTSVWLDRVPKGILSLLIFIGGIIVPLRLYFKSQRINYRKSGWWIWPTWVCLPVALLATVTTWPSKIEHNTNWQFYFDQAQEVKEFYIAFFILLFIVSLNRRLKKLRQQGVDFSPN